jgi:glycosyltransferase involved in cell wall biosynthesis
MTLERRDGGPLMTSPDRRITVLHFCGRMTKGGGLQKVVLDLVRRVGPPHFRSLLVVYNRATGLPELDLAGAPLLSLQAGKPESPWWRQWHFARDLRRTLVGERVDILHAHSPATHRIAWLAAAGLPIHLVRSVQAPLFLSGGKLGLLTGLMRRKTRYFIVPGPDLVENVQDGLGARADRIKIIPNGVDPDLLKVPDRARESARAALGVKEDEVMVLSMGRLVEQKDFLTAVEAAALARTRNAKLKFFIAGEGPQRPMLEESIARLKVQDGVRLIGLRDDEPELLAAADIVLMTSRFEGMSLFLLESMAAGKPVVGTSVIGMTHAGVHEKTMLLVPPQSPAPTADALLRLASDPDLRLQMGRNGRERALSLFSIQKFIHEHEQLYEALVQPAP